MRHYKKLQRKLLLIYGRLFQAFGPQHWWPGQSPFEVMVGAILTQNTNWQNVKKAIDNLKNYNLLGPDKIYRLPLKKLASLIRPSGFFNIKSRRLKNFVEFFVNRYHGRTRGMRSKNSYLLREELLSLEGLGKETVDSILLYALHKAVFVVDAYTRRLLSRHNLADERSSYDDIQRLFMENLPQDVKLFNEYHALIVRLGKEFCKKEPLCKGCVLNGI